MDNNVWSSMTELVRIPVGEVELLGDLELPASPKGLVVFAHGSGSSRHSPRNQQVARHLREAGSGTLLLDLLTVREEAVDLITRELRFDVDLLAQRLARTTDWLGDHTTTRGLGLAYFGASTGAAAALLAAAQRQGTIRAVVSRGGRPDLAGDSLRRVTAPTLLIVGGNDPVVLELNRRALEQLAGERRLEIIAGATHLFEEPGALEQVSALAREWFTSHFG